MAHQAGGDPIMRIVCALVPIASIAFFAVDVQPSCAAVPLVARTSDPVISTDTSNQEVIKTTVRDRRAYARLLGRHRLALQWISWEYFGVVDVTDTNGTLRLAGEQRSRDGEDYVKVDGVITSIDAKRFRLTGSVSTKVSHINGGKPCTRAGDMTFKITGKRQYWRLQQMDNPCDAVVDYVDIFFQ
jgi:hypothetical protein